MEGRIKCSSIIEQCNIKGIIIMLDLLRRALNKVNSILKIKATQMHILMSSCTNKIMMKMEKKIITEITFNTTMMKKNNTRRTMQATITHRV
jgi:hypothetical protein